MYYYSKLLGSTTLYQGLNFSMAQVSVSQFFSYVIPQLPFHSTNVSSTGRTYNCIHIILPPGPIQTVRAEGQLETDVR